MLDLVETLRDRNKWIDQYNPQGHVVNEANTKIVLIEPILEALGWDIRDPDEVHREYRRLPGDNPVDYALLLLHAPQLLVEAKSMSERLDDPKWANQTVAYATAAGVEWVVLTNGTDWRIYNAHAPVPLEQKLFRSVKIREDLDTAAATLRLIGKENMRNNRIKELWKVYCVDQQVSEALRYLFDGVEPAKQLVDAVRHRAKNLTPKDIRTSLTRVRVTFEFPTVSDEAIALPGAAYGTADSGSPAGQTNTIGGSQGASNIYPEPANRYRRVSLAERKLSIPDLIKKGLLSPGALLEASLPGAGTYSATVLPDGYIEYAGTSYKTPSAAGAAVREASAGRALAPNEKATDGWQFWRTRDASGTIVTLKEMRRHATDVQ
ncbi:MAG: restriction endonuclease [Actinobacteria bacterium]|nr:restriction endonuclease [Actinomycetota bacterium]MCL5446920.1 restriction endonuclease [Actinomycetota bacterium]